MHTQGHANCTFDVTVGEADDVSLSLSSGTGEQEVSVSQLDILRKYHS